MSLRSISVGIKPGQIWTHEGWGIVVIEVGKDWVGTVCFMVPNRRSRSSWEVGHIADMKVMSLRTNWEIREYE